MNRTHLERAAEAIVSGLGYAFAAVPDGRAPLAPYPAALLAPLELRSVEGRKHGLATYSATLRLMRDGARTNPAGRREAAAALENDLLAVFAALADDERVVAVEQLTIRPEEGGPTHHAAIVQRAEARIITCF